MNPEGDEYAKRTLDFVERLQKQRGYDEICRDIVELSELAYKNGLDSLTVAFDIAREAAEVELSKANLSTLNS